MVGIGQSQPAYGDWSVSNRFSPGALPNFCPHVDMNVYPSGKHFLGSSPGQNNSLSGIVSCIARSCNFLGFLVQLNMGVRFPHFVTSI